MTLPDHSAQKVEFIVSPFGKEDQLDIKFIVVGYIFSFVYSYHHCLLNNSSQVLRLISQTLPFCSIDMFQEQCSKRSLHDCE